MARAAEDWREIMGFTAQDSLGFLLATLAAFPLLVLPGLAVSRLFDLLSYRTLDRRDRWAVGLMVAHAVVPLLTCLLGRTVGLPLTIAALLGLAVCAWPDLPALVGRVQRGAAVAAILAVAGTGLLVVDWAAAGALYPSLLQIDLVKHAAITRVIAEHGVPPADPFFWRAGAASYYYFYYTPAALIDLVGDDLIDARMAFAGLIPWTALAAVLLADDLYRRAGFTRKPDERRIPLLLVLMACAGAQLLYVATFWIKGETWREQSTWLNDSVNSFLITSLWVPHHLAALIASWCGFLLLVDAIAHARRRTLSIITAGVAFAGVAGLSVYVAIGAAATLAVWLVLLARNRRSTAVVTILAAGAFSLFVALPHLIDLQANRSFADAPLGFRIRQFVVADSAADLLGGGQIWLRLLLLPLNYLLEAGTAVAGTLAFWAHRRRQKHAPNDVAHLLAISAAVSVLIASCVASVIANNDLGWRIILFAQLSALLWTTHVIWPFWRRTAATVRAMATLRFVPRPMTAFLVLGLLGTAHDIVMLRAYPLANRNHKDGEAIDPALNADLRAAYTWLAAHTPRKAIVQHNPNATRAFAFGLYGRNPTSVSDLHGATLFGAGTSLAANRLSDLIPVFSTALPAAEARARLERHGVDLVLVTSADRAWQDAAGWLHHSPAHYQTARIRIVKVDEIAAIRSVAAPRQQ